MTTLTRTITLIAGSVAFAPSAMAHPGHENELGVAHVMTSPEHVVAFLVIGAAAAVLMLVRRPWAVVVANVALLAFLIYQGAAHGSHGGLLFGVETAMAGAVLALGAWRVTHMIYQYYASQRAARAVARVRKS